MKVRFTYPDKIIDPELPKASEISGLTTAHLMLPERAIEAATRIDVVDDDGMVLRVLKDRNGPVS